MGPYCSNCGQHAHESARSVSVLFHDAWHTATHLDSRLWQSLYILLFKPGRLTTEYFAERRARYLPPVRLYLVLSVLFFGFGLATPEKSNEPPPAAPRDAATSHAAPNDAATAHAAAPNDAATSHAAPNEAAPEGAAEAGKTSAAKKKSRKSRLGISNCDDIHISIPSVQNSLRQSCARNPEIYAESVKHAIVANFPKMMFLLVPMMALLMLILYWRPRRYYVEHLVFFIHSHAAIFLLLLIQALLGWIAAWLSWGTFSAWVIAIITLYSAWYVYRAMRVYYGQGRLLTLTKLFVVGFVYLVGFAFTWAATALVSAIIV
jgi:hypothetical protein